MNKNLTLATLAAAEVIVAAARVKYDANLFAQAPLLRAVCRTGIGYDNVNVADATKFGIAVCNVPDGPTISTTEDAVCLMLAVAKNLHRSCRVFVQPTRDPLRRLLKTCFAISTLPSDTSFYAKYHPVFGRFSAISCGLRLNCASSPKRTVLARFKEKLYAAAGCGELAAVTPLLRTANLKNSSNSRTADRSSKRTSLRAAICARTSALNAGSVPRRTASST